MPNTITEIVRDDLHRQHWINSPAQIESSQSIQQNWIHTAIKDAPMSIMNRLNRIIRSNVSDLRGESRSESIDQVLGEMETSLRDARRQAVILRRQEKKLVAAIREQRDKADQWEDRAMMALKQGEEDLARDALKVRNEALERASSLREELDDQRVYAQDIDSAIQALEMKLEGTRGKFGSLGSSRRAGRASSRTRSDEGAWDAEFRRRVEGNDAPGAADEDRGGAGFHDERLFREVDRMGSKINEFEAEVEAMRELSDENLRDPGRSRLDERFRELERRRRSERDDSGHDDLADLKKKFED
jgi:phage shock protein A